MVMRGLILAVFSGVLTVMVPAVAAQELNSLQVYAGFVSEAPGDFDSPGLPELALSPDFEEDTTSYAATLPFSALPQVPKRRSLPATTTR